MRLILSPSIFIKLSPKTIFIVDFLSAIIILNIIISISFLSFFAFYLLRCKQHSEFFTSNQTDANDSDRHIRSSSIYTRVNSQTVIKLHTSIVTLRPVNQKWKPESSSVTSQFSSLLIRPEFEIRSNCSLTIQFQLVIYLLIELLNSIRKRAKLKSQSKVLEKMVFSLQFCYFFLPQVST